MSNIEDIQTQLCSVVTEHEEKEKWEYVAGFNAAVAILMPQVQLRDSKVALYKEYCDLIDAILEFRELLETYELEFSVSIPVHLRPTRVDSNPAKIYENRYERWLWILRNCPDERISVVAIALQEHGAEEQFCSMVASLYTLVSKRIHLPNSRNHTCNEVIDSLKKNGMLTDPSLENVVHMLMEVMPQMKTKVTSTYESLKRPRLEASGN